MKKIKLLLVALVATFGVVLTIGTSKVFANENYNIYWGNNSDTIQQTFRNKLIHYSDKQSKGITINEENYSEYYIGVIEGMIYMGNRSKGDTFFSELSGDVNVQLRNVSIDLSDKGLPTNILNSITGNNQHTDSFFLTNDLVFKTENSIEYMNNINVSDMEFAIYFSENQVPDLIPGISGEHTVINNIDAPYTEARIRQIANLKAYDEYYGDISEDIVIVRDDYTENNTKVGSFEIEYKVTNKSGLSTTFILIVSNKDITKPVIQGPGTSTMSYTEEFVLSNLMAKFTVTDNYDEKVPLVKESDNHVDGVPGTYQFKFSATDKSKNVTTFTHTLNVIDDIRPIFTDINDGVLEVNWRDKVTDEVFLLGLSAHDEIDGERTSHIKIIENNQHNEVGKTYTVKYEVSDKAGNKAQLTRTYKVITTDNPVFWVSKNLLLISDVNSLTPEQIADELARYEGINMASFSFIENGYTDNEYYAGEYTIKLAINDVHGTEHIIERTMMVFEENEMPSTELSTWDKVKNFFVQAWNVIKWPFVKGWEIAKSIGNFIKGLFVKKQAISIFLLK